MYEFIKKNDIGEREIKQNSMEQNFMQMKMHMQPDKENCFLDVRVKQKVSAVPVVQMNTETAQGLALWNSIMETTISVVNISIENDLEHGSILVIVNLKDIGVTEGNEQLHMHVKCLLTENQERDTDIQLASGKFASIKMDVDIKNEEKYIWYLEYPDAHITSFIGNCLNGEPVAELTKKAREAAISKYLDENGKYLMYMLTAREQIFVGNNSRV